MYLYGASLPLVHSSFLHRNNNSGEDAEDSESEKELDIPDADLSVGKVDQDDGASTDDDDNFDWNKHIESV